MDFLSPRYNLFEVDLLLPDFLVFAGIRNPQEKMPFLWISCSRVIRSTWPAVKYSESLVPSFTYFVIAASGYLLCHMDSPAGSTPLTANPNVKISATPQGARWLRLSGKSVVSHKSLDTQQFTKNKMDSHTSITCK